MASSMVLVTKVNRQSSVSNTERSVSRKHVAKVWDSLSRPSVLESVCTLYEAAARRSAHGFLILNQE